MTVLRLLMTLLACCASLSIATEPSSTTERMRSLVIPKLSLKDVPLARALDELCKASIQADPKGVGITILLAPKKGQRPEIAAAKNDPFADGDWALFDETITIKLFALSVFDALAVILEEAEVAFRVQGHVVWVGLDPDLPGSPPPVSVYAMPRTAIVALLGETEGSRSQTLPARPISLTHTFTFGDVSDSVFYTYDPVEELLYVRDPVRSSVERMMDLPTLFTNQVATLGQTTLSSLALSNANANAVSAALSRSQTGRSAPIFSYLKGRELTRSTTLTSGSISLSAALSVLEGLHGWRHVVRPDSVIITSGEIHDYELIREQLTLSPRLHTLLETQSPRDYLLSLGITVDAPARIRYIPHTRTLYLTHTPAIIQLIRDINQALSHD